MRILFALMLLCSLASCDSTSQEVGEVTASATESSIIILNETGEPVYYNVIGEKADVNTNWLIVSRDENRINDGQLVELAFSAIDPRGDEEAYIISWWHAEEVDGELVNEDVQSFILTL